ncbi:MAG TPA: hypothetical protein VGP72_31835 [Planctomycetota bacterium]|jgi:hypothetical protein
MYRHGDVLIEAVTEIPNGARKLPDCTLAQGELTGHSHRVAQADAAELYESSGVLFLRVIKEQATIVHQEHKQIDLPQGLYRVWRQREYSPEEIRIVRD